jgi:hypothetical protein
MSASLGPGGTVGSKADASLDSLKTPGGPDSQATAGHRGGVRLASDGGTPGAWSPALARGLPRGDSTRVPSFRSQACSPSISPERRTTFVVQEGSSR